MAVADLNGDYVPDLVAACPDAGSVSLFISVGPSRFQPGISIPAGTRPELLAAAEVTGDQNLDVIVGSSRDTELRVLAGLGNGSLQTPLKVPVGAAVRALLAASPLTALLPPVGVGLLPELAGQAAWLRLPAVARLVVARYLALGAAPAVAEAGEAVGALLRQRERTLSSSDLMTLLCLVSHLHVCVALSETPLPAAS